MRNSQKNIWLLVLFILIGSLAGIILGDLINMYFKPLFFLTRSYSIGTKTPFVVNLKVLDFTFGVNFYLNILSIIGMILAIIIYRKL